MVHILGLIVDDSRTELNGRPRNLKHNCRDQAIALTTLNERYGNFSLITALVIYLLG